MTPEDINEFEARMDLLRPEVEEYYELEALLLNAELEYLVMEGFVETEEVDGELFLHPVANAVHLEIPDDCS